MLIVPNSRSLISKTSRLKFEAWGLSDGKKGSRLRLCFRVVDDVPEKKRMDLWKQMSSSRWSFTCICEIFFALKPVHDYNLCSVWILPQPAFYSQSAVCIYPWSAVCSPQSAVRSLPLTLTAVSLIVNLVPPPPPHPQQLSHLGLTSAQLMFFFSFLVEKCPQSSKNHWDCIEIVFYFRNMNVFSGNYFRRSFQCVASCTTFYVINYKFQTRPNLKYGCLRVLSSCRFSSLYTANLHGDIVCEE